MSLIRITNMYLFTYQYLLLLLLFKGDINVFIFPSQKRETYWYKSFLHVKAWHFFIWLMTCLENNYGFSFSIKVLYAQSYNWLFSEITVPWIYSLEHRSKRQLWEHFLTDLWLFYERENAIRILGKWRRTSTIFIYE